MLGLDWEYDAHEVSEDQLPEFLLGLDSSWRGLSLTMPLKRTVVPLLDAMSERATQALAANTVVLDERGRTGHNTDVPGVAAAIRERYDGPVDRAVVVGGGATAASALLGLADLGCRHVTLMVREEARAAPTVATAARHPAAPAVEVRRLDGSAPEADIVVSTIPASAQGAEVLATVEAATVAFDVIYDPWPTPLATRAADAGRVLVSGLDLLVHQAVLQVELMTGLTTGSSSGAASALLEAMRAAGESALEARRAPPAGSSSTGADEPPTTAPRTH